MALWKLTLSLFVCVNLCVSEVRGSYIPIKMNQTIHSLLRHYKTSMPVFNGKPVFPHPFSTGRTETKMVLMGGVLQTYDTLLSRMLDQLPTSSPDVKPSVASNAIVSGPNVVRDQLNYIRNMVRELKNAHFKEQVKLLKDLKDLSLIQMDNGAVQSKALREFIALYDDASQLSNSVMTKRRRRRQTKGRKRLEV